MLLVCTTIIPGRGSGVDKAAADFAVRGPKTYRIQKLFFFFGLVCGFLTEGNILDPCTRYGSNFADNYKDASDRIPALLHGE